MAKDNIDALLGFVKNAGKRHVKVQVAWATVKSVDWDTKTMVATGVADDLDYNDVLLGLGACYRKPKVGTKCLLGLIENNDAASFLIEAEELELVEWNGGVNEGLVKVKALEDNLNALKNYVEAINASLPGAFRAVGASSAANGANGASSYNLAMTGQNIQFVDMQNEKIKH